MTHFARMIPFGNEDGEEQRRFVFAGRQPKIG